MLTTFTVFAVLVVIIYLIQRHKYINKDDTYYSKAVLFAQKSLERQNLYDFSEDLAALSKQIIQTTLTEKKDLFNGKICKRPHFIAFLIYSFAQTMARTYEQRTNIFYLSMAAYLENIFELQKNRANYKLSKFEISIVEDAINVTAPILESINNSPLTKELSMLLNHQPGNKV